MEAEFVRYFEDRKYWKISTFKRNGIPVMVACSRTTSKWIILEDTGLGAVVQTDKTSDRYSGRIVDHLLRHDYPPARSIDIVYYDSASLCVTVQDRVVRLSSDATLTVVELAQCVSALYAARILSERFINVFVGNVRKNGRRVLSRDVDGLIASLESAELNRLLPLMDGTDLVYKTLAAYSRVLLRIAVVGENPFWRRLGRMVLLSDFSSAVSVTHM